jgi:hypothetical protein
MKALIPEKASWEERFTGDSCVQLGWPIRDGFFTIL